jgi:hypothetical protein
MAAIREKGGERRRFFAFAVDEAAGRGCQRVCEEMSEGTQHVVTDAEAEAEAQPLTVRRKPTRSLLAPVAQGSSVEANVG